MSDRADELAGILEKKPAGTTRRLLDTNCALDQRGPRQRSRFIPCVDRAVTPRICRFTQSPNANCTQGLQNT